MKRRTRILVIVASALVLVVLVVVANVHRSRSAVGGIEVVIRYGDMEPLLTEQTVRDSVVARLPGLLQGTVSQVDRQAVAEAAASIPYLRRVTVATSVSGRVVIRAFQRRPIMHLYYGNADYYLDAEQCLMPASTVGAVNVLVAGGDFGEPLRADSLSTQVLQLWQVASFLDRQKKYSDMIDQIYAEADGDIMMVPKLGNHVVELGSADNLEEKFASLLTFYRKGMPRAGWDTYGKISLKYKGQVVCTKRSGTN